MKRSCGDCSLCCTLLPVKDINKPANTRCDHQSHAKGCKIYRRYGFPMSCRFWSCRWLTGGDTANISRPDRAGYVIDPMPDFIRIRDDVTGAQTPLQVVQVWVDPKRRDAHRDPRLREYLSRRADEGAAALIRYGSHDGFVLFAPQFTGGRGWMEEGGVIDPNEHSVHEIVQALGDGWEAVDLSKKKQT